MEIESEAQKNKIIACTNKYEKIILAFMALNVSSKSI